ncbi:DUF4270 family protein [Larkinella sp. VNQ87]|uniref:DUF4270 family protein n=1 Tax=Larkinella sp. VNQ87 TaxID=3400921 RepID=UPI003BFBCD44
MQTFLRFALPMLTALIAAACMSGDLDVGQNLIKPDENQIQYIDTMTVQLSTVMVPDSFITSSDSSVVVGRWADTQTGLMEARGFASLSYVTNDLPDQRGIRFDSLVLEMDFSYAVGDTLNTFPLRIHQLQQALDVNAVHYNTQSEPYKAQPLVQTAILPQFAKEIEEGKNRQIRIRLPEALSRTFYEKLITKEINDAETMGEFWKGFAFLSPVTQNTFLAFNLTSANSGIRLYYRGNDISQTTYELLFPFQAAHFSSLTNNRAGTPLQALQRLSDAVPSQTTQKASFVVPGAFLYTRIEIPSLSSFIKPTGFIGLNRAELVLEPIRKNIRDNAAPPDQLGLFFTNSQNETVEAVPGQSTGTTSAVASYAAFANELEFEDTYTFNLTYQLNRVLRGETTNRPMLLRVPSSELTLKTMLQRATLGNWYQSEDRVRLKLYLTIASGTGTSG